MCKDNYDRMYEESYDRVYIIWQVSNHLKSSLCLFLKFLLQPVSLWSSHSVFNFRIKEVKWITGRENLFQNPLLVYGLLEWELESDSSRDEVEWWSYVFLSLSSVAPLKDRATV